MVLLFISFFNLRFASSNDFFFSSRPVISFSKRSSTFVRTLMSASYADVSICVAANSFFSTFNSSATLRCSCRASSSAFRATAREFCKPSRSNFVIFSSLSFCTSIFLEVSTAVLRLLVRIFSSCRAIARSSLVCLTSAIWTSLSSKSRSYRPISLSIEFKIAS